MSWVGNYKTVWQNERKNEKVDMESGKTVDAAFDRASGGGVICTVCGGYFE